MLTVLVQPVLKMMNFLYSSFVFLLKTSYHVGQAIFCILVQTCSIIRDIFSVISIIGEELYYFICGLSTSVSAASSYVRTSANGGITCVLEAGGLFLHHIAKFFSNTQLHSKLLATHIGCFISDLFKLGIDALLLIADCAWCSIIFLPKLVFFATIAVGDIIIEFTTSILNSLVNAVQIIIEDIFRLTIGLVLLYVSWHNRLRCRLAVQRLCLKIKRLTRLAFLRIFALGRRPLRPINNRPVTTTATRTLRRSPLHPPRSLTPGRGEKPLDAAQRCVICRDCQKCVLLLPCKHLCLCEDCANYLLFTIQRQECPLCRTNIENTMSVYI